MKKSHSKNRPFKNAKRRKEQNTRLKLLRDACHASGCYECSDAELMKEHEEFCPYSEKNFKYHCVACGSIHPDWYTVDDKEWKRYVPRGVRGMEICQACYEKIKSIADSGGGIPNTEVDFFETWWSEELRARLAKLYEINE
jgi:hypothetical protein